MRSGSVIYADGWLVNYNAEHAVALLAFHWCPTPVSFNSEDGNQVESNTITPRDILEFQFHAL